MPMVMVIYHNCYSFDPFKFLNSSQKTQTIEAIAFPQKKAKAVIIFLSLAKKATDCLSQFCAHVA